MTEYSYELKIPNEWVERYRKGTKPPERIEMGEFEQIKEQFISLIDQAEEDYATGLFRNYQAYTTSFGVQINTIEDVIRFIYAHEAFHWGIIAAMKKIV